MRIGLALVVLISASACSSNAVPFTPAAFERPGDVAFVCFDTNQDPDLPVSLDLCRKDAAGLLTPGFWLHGLVIQTARGEIAAVDLVNNVLLDSDRSVPGFTFIEAGDLPSAIVVPTIAPTDGSRLHAYVANAGSRDIWSIPTQRFRTPEYGVDPWTARVDLEGGPTALALSPDERFLFAAVPERGSIYQIEILNNGGLGTPTEIVLGTDVPAAVVGTHDDPYARICSTATVLDAGARPTRAVETEGTLARPATILIDKYSAVPQLLVADSALPIVHRLPIDGSGLGAELPGIAVEVPTRDIAVTPVVPTEIDGSGTSRYMYAIDVHGDVMAVDFTDGASFGQVLSVNVPYSRTTDRLAFLPLATTLEVITPGYDETAPASGLCAPPTATSVAANRLHGVFLSVGFADGTVRLADIYDLDAPCRGEVGACSMSAGLSSADQYAYIRRHRPRIGETIVNQIGATGAVAFVTNGATWPISPLGTTASPDTLPSLSSAAACPTGFVDAYPRDGVNDALICTLGDPWSAIAETWTAQYEGILLGGEGGRLADGNSFISESSFCAHGVLGSANIPATDSAVPESLGTRDGDQLVVTADLPPGETRAQCLIYAATDPATGLRLPLAFQIIEAFDDHLALGDMIGRSDIGGDARSLPALRDCFGELISFSVRTRSSYLVGGSRSGNEHRVIAATGGACTVDTTADVLWQSRASGGVPFANRHVSFEIGTFSGVASTTSFSFTIGGVPLQLGADVGQQPTEMHYTDVDGYLYAVDTASQALVRMQLNEFRVLNTFR